MSTGFPRVTIINEPMSPNPRYNNRQSQYIALRFNKSPDIHLVHSKPVINVPKLDTGLIKVKKVPTGLRNIYSKVDAEFQDKYIETTQAHTHREKYPKSILKNKIHHVNSMSNLHQKSFNINNGIGKSVTFTREAPEVINVLLKEKKPRPLPHIDEKAVAKCQCLIY